MEESTKNNANLQKNNAKTSIWRERLPFLLAALGLGMAAIALWMKGGALLFGEAMITAFLNCF